MKSLWLHRYQNERLIIFCNGWGMDASPFQPIGARDYDVIMLYDYSDLSLDCDFPHLFKEYGFIYLIAWSMGIWAGQQIFRPWAHYLKSAIAINGTLCPIHDRFGIPVQLYNTTLNQFNQISRLKFYRRMCRSSRTFETFLENQPKRSVENQGRELAALQGHVNCDLADTSIYTKIMIADHDFIVPTVNQKTFWREHEVLRIKGGHFLFYDWNSWDELIATSLGTKEGTQNIS